LGLIEDYREGLLPLIVPLILPKHHLNRHPVPAWVPVPSVASGAPAGISQSVSEGVDVAQSRVGPARVTVDQEAFESGHGWLGSKVFVV
jgi:hypothetical protein